MELTEGQKNQARLAGLSERKQRKVRQLTVELDEFLFNSLKGRAGFEGRKLKDVIESLVRLYLEKGGEL